MQKTLSTVLCILVFGTAAMAQGKVDTKWHCPSVSAPQKYDVGDVPDHSYQINQGTCNSASSSKGFAEKSAAFTEFQETWKDRWMHRGQFNSTMENGDMAYYSYSGSGSTDPKKGARDTWKIMRGTGKYKGVIGMGTCSGMFNDDGSSDWHCTGTYSMGTPPSKDKM